MSFVDPLNSARDYARNKYTAKCEELSRGLSDKITLVQHQFAARGLGQSGPLEKVIGDIRADLLRELIRARVDSLIDGFELYGVPLTGEITDFIIQEAKQVHAQGVDAASKADAIRANRTGNIALEIVRQVGIPVAAIRCQIEERRLKPQMRPQPQQVTNVYHVTGENSRVNVQSNDQSVNVVITSSDEVFRKIREAIQVGIPAEEQAKILSYLTDLERAQTDRSFATRYTDFIAAAANHMTVLGPFIPALSELLKKVL